MPKSMSLKIFFGRLDGRRAHIVAAFTKKQAAEIIGKGGMGAINDYMGQIPEGHRYRSFVTEPGMWIQENWRDAESEFTRKR